MIFFLRYNSVDVNVAVATDAGLITPIIFKADTKVSTIQMLKYRARKSCRTLQNKVRLKVLPEQLTLFVNTFVAFQKMHHSIVFYFTVLIIAQKYTLFHIALMKISL